MLIQKQGDQDSADLPILIWATHESCVYVIEKAEAHRVNINIACDHQVHQRVSRLCKLPAGAFFVSDLSGPSVLYRRTNAEGDILSRPQQRHQNDEGKCSFSHLFFLPLFWGTLL